MRRTEKILIAFAITIAALILWTDAREATRCKFIPERCAR